MGEVRTEWCPTEDMVADFMTKPLQGSTFVRFRDLIMGAVSMKGMTKKSCSMAIKLVAGMVNCNGITDSPQEGVGRVVLAGLVRTSMFLVYLHVAYFTRGVSLR